LAGLVFFLVLQGVLIGHYLAALRYQRWPFSSDATGLDVTLGYAILVLLSAVAVQIGREIVRRAAKPASSR
jgi:hypothetical protein